MSEKTIDVKQAVTAASAYLSELFPKGELHDLALEEVELSDDGQYWYVTMGFNRQLAIPRARPLRGLDGGGYTNAERVYKLIKVRASDGKPISMKIRFTSVV
jgi:hypothetical protein